MKTARTAILVLVALGLVGCNNEPKAADPGNGGGIKTGVAPEEAKPQVPDALKHAGYQYQGLGNSDLMTYDVTFGDLPMEEGTEQITVEKVEGGTATFKVARTGGLSRLGVDTVELTADGVTMVASSMGLLKEPSKLMLADTAVGTTWETKLNMDNLQNGTQSIESNIKNKVSRMESVKVPAGTFECLVVETTLESTSKGAPNPSQNKKSTVKMTSYYAKDVGIIKLRGTDGTKQTVLVELRARSADKKPEDGATSAPFASGG